MEQSTQVGSFLSGIGDMDQDAFRRDSLAWLRRHIGFDGALWAVGRLHEGRLDMGTVCIDGRPPGLLNDHAPFAPIVAAGLRRAVDVLTHWDTATQLRSGRLAHFRAFLEQYRIRHVLMKGVRLASPSHIAWLVMLREDADQPFQAQASHAHEPAIAIALHALEYIAVLRRTPASASSAASGIHLTERQKQVLHCLFLGWSNKLIARHLGISDNTLKSHLRALYQAMQVRSRSQAILHAGTFVIDDHVDSIRFREGGQY